MINYGSTAKQISNLMLDVSDRIRQSVASIENNCIEEERKAYQKAVTQILATIDSECLGPLFAQHPSLRPEGWTRTEKHGTDRRSLGGIIQPV